MKNLKRISLLFLLVSGVGLNLALQANLAFSQTPETQKETIETQEECCCNHENHHMMGNNHQMGNNHEMMMGENAEKCKNKEMMNNNNEMNCCPENLPSNQQNTPNEK